MNKTITVEALIKAPIEKVWQYWNEPEHITQWAFASETWEAPDAQNDLREGGRFKTTMSAKDKTSSFDFTGTYTVVKKHELIEYDMDKAITDQENRHVKIEFTKIPDGVKIIETFDMETENSEELQAAGWQAILNNFKKHVESNY